MRTKNNNKKLERIINLIKKQGVPSFIKSAQIISKLTDNENADMKALCDVIMKDPGMTTRLIRASNKAYNVRRGRCNTVSRAVVMLGVREVRNICLAGEVVDGLTKGASKKKVRKELIHELVRAFFSAVHARQLSIQNRDRHSEEVFLGALIKRLGRIIFWQIENEYTEKLAYALNNSNRKPEVVEKEILGFTLDELSTSIIEAWELDNLIPDVKNNDKDADRRNKEINFSNEMATASMRGWESEYVKAVIDKICTEFSFSKQSVQSLIDRTCQEACETALFFGIEEAESVLPEMISDKVLDKQRKELCANFIPKNPDDKAQLACFKRIPELMTTTKDVRLILFEIMEGMSNGLGLDRAIFALVDDSRNYLSARLVNAPDYSIFLKKFKFSVQENSENFFSKIYIDAKSHWFKVKDENYNSLTSEEFKYLFGEHDFFLAPIIVNDNYIGCFYGDRAISNRELDESSFETFSQYALQAQIAISYNS